MCSRIAAGPTTFRYVSCWPAKEAVGRSSAVALDRTAYAARSPSRASERAGDRRRKIVGDGDPFEGPADLRAERADRLPVIRVQARQPIKPIVHRPRFRHDPPEGIRRHTEASRPADAFDPRKLT